MNKITGYESVQHKLLKFTKEYYDNSENKEDVIQEMLDIIRSVNTMPLYQFTHDGILNEIKKCIDFKPTFDGKILKERSIHGQHLCSFLFPNLQTVECKGVKNNSMYDRFYDDNKLKKTIKFVLTYESYKNPYTSFYRPSKLIGGNVATNFPPMRAKALYEKYCPKNGIIYDFSCGFGGRMLGALSSKNNYAYVGVEPCTETYDSLLKLGSYIDEITDKDRYIIIKNGSEIDNFNQDEFVDFAFSSPPYFSLEKYSDEESQCYIKYDTLEDWVKFYVKPTIENIYKYLKNGCYYAVNIADFKINKQNFKYVDEWIKISKEVGFTFQHQIDFKLNTVKRSGFENTDVRSEGIFIFKK